MVREGVVVHKKVAKTAQSVAADQGSEVVWKAEVEVVPS